MSLIDNPFILSLSPTFLDQTRPLSHQTHRPSWSPSKFNLELKVSHQTHHGLHQNLILILRAQPLESDTKVLWFSGNPITKLEKISGLWRGWRQLIKAPSGWAWTGRCPIQNVLFDCLSTSQYPEVSINMYGFCLGFDLEETGWSLSCGWWAFVFIFL